MRKNSKRPAWHPLGIGTGRWHAGELRGHLSPDSTLTENAEKPFHMMTNVVEGIEVIEIKRKCFSTATMKHFYVTILRLSLAHIYNNNMNSVTCGSATQSLPARRPLASQSQMVVVSHAVVLGASGGEWLPGCTSALANVGVQADDAPGVQEQVATAWCITPMLILGNRKQAQRQQKLLQTKRRQPQRLRLRRLAKKRWLYLTPKRLDACAQSYKMNPAMHVVGDVQSFERDDQSKVETTEWTPKCQICNKGLCKHAIDNDKVGKRCQIEATMCCMWLQCACVQRILLEGTARVCVRIKLTS